MLVSSLCNHSILPPSSRLCYRYAYFHDMPQADLPYIKIPLHTVIKLTPKAYGCDEERYASILAHMAVVDGDLPGIPCL